PSWGNTTVVQTGEATFPLGHAPVGCLAPPCGARGRRLTASPSYHVPVGRGQPGRPGGMMKTSRRGKAYASLAGLGVAAMVLTACGGGPGAPETSAASTESGAATGKAEVTLYGTI